ncbi:MAG: hypothetical protein R2791_14805 [Saprospiraceae bacterium]
MVSKTTTLIIFLFVFIFNIQSQNVDWISQVSENGLIEDYGSYNTSVTTDRFGNVYSAGVLKKNHQTDGLFLISKRNSLGKILWENTFSLTDLSQEIDNPSLTDLNLENNNQFDEIIYSITLTTFSRILVVGESNEKSILITLNNTGTLFNVSVISGNENKIVAGKSPLSSLGVPSGPTIIAGYFRGSIELPGNNSTITLTSEGGTDVFIGKWSVDRFLEVAHLSGNNDQVPFDIEIDQEKNVFLSYLTKNNVKYNGQSISSFSSDGFSGYILKIDSDFSLIYNESPFLGENQILLQQPTHLSGKNESGGDEMVKFPISLNEDDNEVYFFYNRKSGQNIDQKRILGKTSKINGSLINTVYVNLNSVVEPFSPLSRDYLIIEDLIYNECDSLYLIGNLFPVSGGPLVGDFSNLSTKSHLLIFEADNLSKINNIPTEGSMKFSRLSLDNNRNVFISGFYTGEWMGFGTVQIDGNDFFESKAIVAKYSPCSEASLQIEMISGPQLICPANYPINWNMIAPDNTSGCQLIIEQIGDNPSPTSIIDYTGTTNFNFIINNLNGYSFPIKVRYQCIQNCCDSIFDEKILYPALALIPKFEELNITSELNGNISVNATSVELEVPNIVFMWQLYEGLVDNSNPENIQVVILGEGTDSENLIYEEYDDVNNTNSVDFSFSGLEANKAYVIKLGVYYHYPDIGTCGWYETRKGFIIDGNGNYRLSGDNVVYKIKGNRKFKKRRN